ncbi:hypothetical protein bcgnr5372_25180 [Bacillus luti]|nr:hypothetical protein [Bacillus cereus]HDR8328464.1 hypothetical protein [Bacillus cereus]HDR8334227.1 hypothetical protein [Bacillus cereus]
MSEEEAVLATTVTLAVGLVGCSKSPKDTFVDAHADLQKAKTYESDSKITAKLDGAGKPEYEQVSKILDSAQIKFNTLANVDKEQYEVKYNLNLDQGPMKIDLTVPVYMENSKVYMKADEFEKMTSFYGGMELPSELKGKIIELDTGKNVDKEKQKQLQEKMQEDLYKIVKDVPKENFKKTDNTVSVSIPGNKASELVEKYLKEGMKAAGQEVDKNTAKELEKALKENVEFGNIVVNSTIEKGEVKKEVFTIPVTVKSDGEKVTLKLKVENTYKQFNKPVKFSFNVDKKNVIKFEDFQKKLTDIQSEGFEVTSEEF